MLSGAAGSIIIKYVNSSYFWVCTSLSKMSLKAGLLSYAGNMVTGSTTVGVITAASVAAPMRPRAADAGIRPAALLCFCRRA